jgi:SAM-dependent methyltransferase
VPSPVNQRLLDCLAGEPLARATALDVGTGRGALAFALAPRCHRVIGIDCDATAIGEATRLAGLAGIENVEFAVRDAEDIEYAPFAPDLVVAHLCMSDAIVERASRALAPESVLAFACFHVDQWRETGRRSRFAYEESQMALLLARTGFALEFIEIDRDVREFGTVEEGLSAVVDLEERWSADGRWFRFIKFLEEGGRTLTRSHLVVKARRR